MNEETIIFSGTISVKAVLEQRKRKICRLLVNPKKRSRDISYIIHLAKEQKIPVEYLDGEAMTEIARSNGGVILEAFQRSFQKADEAEDLKGLSTALFGIEDPYDLGSCARSAWAAGASRLFVYERDWSHGEDTLMRSSAGAWEKLEIYTADQEQLVDLCRRHSLDLVSACRNPGSISLFEAELPQNVCIAIGGAFRGLSSSLIENSTQKVYIPYGREFRNSLDAPSAASLFCFAWLKQKQTDL